MGKPLVTILTSVTCGVLIIWACVSMSLQMYPYLQRQVEIINSLREIINVVKNLDTRVAAIEQANKK